MIYFCYIQELSLCGDPGIPRSSTKDNISETMLKFSQNSVSGSLMTVDIHTKLSITLTYVRFSVCHLAPDFTMSLSL